MNATAMKQIKKINQIIKSYDGIKLSRPIHWTVLLQGGDEITITTPLEIAVAIEEAQEKAGYVITSKAMWS